MRRALLAAAAILLASASGSAQRLSDVIVPHHYDLTFAPEFTNDTFTGAERIEVEIRRQTRTIVLHALDLDLSAVRITQRNVTQPARVELDRDNEQASLTVERPLTTGRATIELRFAGRLTGSLEGLYLSKSATRKYAVTQFESTDARRAFPSFDEPAFKATFAISAIVDRADTAISNGAIVTDTPGPGAAKHTLKFSTTAKMSTYLVALAVGDFQCLTGGADGIPIRMCATPDKVQLGRFALSAAEQSLSYFNRYFEIDYPFGKLDIVAVPDFAAGAMENTGAVFAREFVLADEARTAPSMLQAIASVMSHEVLHHWFGDLVTMRWWDDIWLNEGFTTWMEMKPIHAWRPAWRLPAADVRGSRRSISRDALETARPIRTAVDQPADIEQLFDSLTYGKAAAVLQMTENYVGEESFRRGINAYIKKYAYANATAENFWTVMTETTGKPVDRIMRSFVDQSGLPVVSVGATCDGGRTRVALRQQRFVFNADARIAGATWAVPVCLRSAENATCTLLDRPEQVVTLKGCHNTVFANPSAQGYYITAYDSPLLKAVAASADDSLNAEERFVFVDDAWALVRNGRYRIGDFLDIVDRLKDQLASGDWDIGALRLTYIGETLIDSATADRFSHWVRQLLRPAFTKLGWDAQPGEPVEHRTLRASIISALGRFGRDAEILADAKRRADRYLLNERDADPTMLDTVILLAARDGDDTLYDRLRSKATSQGSPQDAERALFALTQFTDPKLISRTLEYAVSPEVRRQDVPLLLGGMLRNPAGREIAWSFVKTRWSDVSAKIDGPFGSIVGATSGFCDARLRDDVKQFFTEHPLPGSDRPLRQAIESMENCIRLKDQQAHHLAAWLH